jgi:hypothetical protein
MTDEQLFRLLMSQLAHTNHLLHELHLTDDGTNYLIGALRCSADLAEAWLAGNLKRADEILTEDYLEAHYASDGVHDFLWRYAQEKSTVAE